MRAANSTDLLLAAVDQLIIRREINLARMEEQLEAMAGPAPGRRALETAIAVANAALARLAHKRADMVMNGP